MSVLLIIYCVILLAIEPEYFYPATRTGATFVFYFLCLLSGSMLHQDALKHKVQIGTEVVGHGGFLADDYNTIEPVYGVWCE